MATQDVRRSGRPGKARYCATWPAGGRRRNGQQAAARRNGKGTAIVARNGSTSLLPEEGQA